MLFWGNEVLTEIGGVLEFYGKENAVRRQWEREEKEEKKENLEGKQRNSKNRTALDTQKEETMDWNTAFAVLRKFYEEKGLFEWMFREMKKRGMRKGNCSAKYTYRKSGGWIGIKGWKC